MTILHTGYAGNEIKVNAISVDEKKKKRKTISNLVCTYKMQGSGMIRNATKSAKPYIM